MQASSTSESITVKQSRKWKKFGVCADTESGPEPGITSISADDVYITWLNSANNEHDDIQDGDGDIKEQAARAVKAQLKKEWLHKRIAERKLGSRIEPGAATMNISRKVPSGTNSNLFSSQTQGKKPAFEVSTSRANKYIPPAKRPGARHVKHSTFPSSAAVSTDVRIGNLSFNASEADVEDLCKGFGVVRRVLIPRDKRTGAHRGSAIISFGRGDDAEKCVRLLDGYGYDHLILSVELLPPKKQPFSPPW